MDWIGLARIGSARLGKELTGIGLIIFTSGYLFGNDNKQMKTSFELFYCEICMLLLVDSDVCPGCGAKAVKQQTKGDK